MELSDGRIGAIVAPSKPSKRAAGFHQTWSNPHFGHQVREGTSGSREKLSESVSIPVEISRPVLGHLIVIMLMVVAGADLDANARAAYQRIDQEKSPRAVVREEGATRGCPKDAHPS